MATAEARPLMGCEVLNIIKNMIKLISKLNFFHHFVLVILLQAQGWAVDEVEKV